MTRVVSPTWRHGPFSAAVCLRQSFSDVDTGQVALAVAIVGVDAASRHATRPQALLERVVRLFALEEVLERFRGAWASLRGARRLRGSPSRLRPKNLIWVMTMTHECNDGGP